ncbi:hypothetical protein N0V84_006270 [Fusarium piperis]|uniref:Low temperature requirement A n=1 Tax=Fusarium piperis TaxID=1435070 RepID=A0A9W9BNR3_9HYPO|nr:hypothetical protein N0V84_006270 [Fusarium piperis]
MGHSGGDATDRPVMISTNTTSVQSDEPGLKLVAGPGDDYERAQSRDDEEPVLQFPKLFYDLWFVANLNVFTTLHPITDVTNLGSFIRYFLLLWITWLATTVHDVRFGKDGVFERISRACHLTVMIGFSAGGVSFSQTKQLQPIFKVMSLCLMCSRLVLSIQYGVVLFYARRNRRSRNNLALAVLLHLVPAIIYMAATIASAKGSKAEINHLWWTVALAELFALMAHATLSKTLSFSGTHLTERLNLLTLIVIGEGIIILAKTITKIVQYTYLKDPTTSWSLTLAKASALFGLIACGAAILYFTFQLYFDWMDHHSHMSPIRQALWTILHLPFHIAIVLTVEGSGQWITWQRTWEAINEAVLSVTTGLTKALDSGMGGQDLVKELAGALDKTYETYTFSVKTVNTMNSELAKLAEFPDSVWKSFATNLDANNLTANDTAIAESLATIYSSLMNAISNTYGLTTSAKVKAQAESYGAGLDAESVALDAVYNRLSMIFVYAFVAAGAALLLLATMHLLQKPKGWSVFHLIRLGLLTIAGVTLCLIALIATNDKMTEDMIFKPWQLPIMALIYLIALVGSHLPSPRGLKASHSSQMDERHKPGDTSGTSQYHD